MENANMVVCRWSNGRGAYLTNNTHRGKPFVDGTTDHFVYEVTCNKENAVLFDCPREIIDILKKQGGFYPEEVC